MKQIFTFLLLLSFSGQLVAQESPSIITEVDYFNATRYGGGRNIARTADGNLAVIFEPASGYTNGSQDIHYVVYNNIFKTWDVAKLSNSPANATGIPAMIAHPDSEWVYAVWKEKNKDGDRDAMFAKLTFIDAFTHQWTTPVVADNIENNTGVITIDIADDGTLFNMFSIWNDPAVYDANVYSSRSTNNGDTWQTYNLTAEFPTPNSLPINWLDVNLTPGKNGDMYAAWEDRPTEITNGDELLFAKYTKTSDSWSTPEIVSPLFDGDAAIHKWVDGCTPVSAAKSVYEMGPEGYELEGKSTVVYYDNGTSKVMSSWFNPHFMEPEEEKNTHVADIVSFFGISGTDSVLLVDDDNRYNQESVMTDALDQAGVNYSVHDCGSLGGLPDNLPTAAQLQNYQLIIWYSGSDGANIAFWNAAEEDNPELVSFLNITNSKLWVIGEDILFDRYGGAADTFQTGDFCYDYLGIESYDVQAQADGPGVSALDKVTDNGLNVSSIDPIAWGAGSIRQGEPSIATDPLGNVHMVYLDENGDHIMYKTYEGDNWSDPVQIDDTPDSVNVQRPNIAIDEKFGIYVTWMQVTHKDTVDTKTWLVYNVVYSTSPDGGDTWNAPIQLSDAKDANSASYSIKNPTIGKNVRPVIEGVFTGGADVVWTEYSEDATLGFNIMYGRIPFVGTVTSIEDKPTGIEYEFALRPNFPNPFNPKTTISFEIDKTQKVSLEIFNPLGQKVAVLVNEKLSAGTYEKTWDALSMPSGVYFARLISKQSSKVQKLLLVK